VFIFRECFSKLINFHPYLLEIDRTDTAEFVQYTHAASPIKAAHDLAFIFDIDSSDVVLWQSHFAKLWEAWAIVGVLTLGATLVIFTSFPGSASSDRLWNLLRRCGVSVLCLTPDLITPQLQKTDIPDFPNLRVIGSTGDTLTRQQWLWAFEHIGQKNRPVINYYRDGRPAVGILGSTTSAPIKVGACSGPVPGVAVGVFDETGQLVSDHGQLAVNIFCPGFVSPDFLAEQPTTCQRLSRWATIDKDGFWFLLDVKDGSSTAKPLPMEEA